MPGQVATRALGRDVGRRPMGERVRFDVSIDDLHEAEAGARTDLVPLPLRHPGAARRQGGCERPHLAQPAAGIRIKIPKLPGRILPLGVERVGLDIAHVAHSQPFDNIVPVS